MSTHKDTGLTGWMIRRFAHEQGRAQLAYLQGGTTMGVNFAIFVFKLILGLLMGSIALTADAFESLSDVAGGLLIVLSMWMACKPADREHPFGHGRVELVGALITAIILIVIALELMQESFMRLIRPEHIQATWWMIGAVALTIPLKLWIAHFSERLSVLSGSPLVEGGYWMLKFDALTTAVVCLALTAAKMKWPFVDGLAGLLVAGVIMKSGIEQLRGRISPLIGEAPSEDEVDSILGAAKSLEGVRGAHDVILHKYGERKLVSLHIEVDAQHSAMKVHDLAEDVEAEVERCTGAKAIVHVDPVDRSHPAYHRVESLLEGCMQANKQLADYHDLRLSEDKNGKMNITLDVVVASGVEENDFPALAKGVENCLREQEKSASEVSVNMESSFGIAEKPFKNGKKAET